jgi:hypothetical protein
MREEGQQKLADRRPGADGTPASSIIIATPRPPPPPPPWDTSYGLPLEGARGGDAGRRLVPRRQPLPPAVAVAGEASSAAEQLEVRVHGGWSCAITIYIRVIYYIIYIILYYMMMLYVIIVAGLEGTGLHGVARSARRIADAARRCGPVWQGSLAKQDAELGRLRAQLAEKMDRAERHAAQTQRAASVMQARQVGFLQEQWPKRGASLGLVAARPRKLLWCAMDGIFLFCNCSGRQGQRDRLAEERAYEEELHALTLAREQERLRRSDSETTSMTAPEHRSTWRVRLGQRIQQRLGRGGAGRRCNAGEGNRERARAQLARAGAAAAERRRRQVAPAGRRPQHSLS